MSDKTERPSESKPHYALIAASITGVAGIVAAIIALHKSPDPPTKAVTVSGQGNPTVVDSSNVHIDRHDVHGLQISEFDKNFGVKVAAATGTYVVGASSAERSHRSQAQTGYKSHFSIALYNASEDDISGLRLAIYPSRDDQDKKPLGVLDKDKFEYKGLAQLDIPLAAAQAPPQILYLCLTFQTKDTGQYVTFLLHAEQDDLMNKVPVDPRTRLKTFRYRVFHTDDAFKSTQPGNCAKRGSVEKVDLADSKIYRK
ncbi:hypothetical protein CBA19CS11_29315 [Caballeronia novacaledonica]|uniref:hypothetical protein n=1 Tax=Caballeronia novacaledonica TaxID=1544861 RepID=UPI001EE29790|nr:hypothetical protein [Caballeronia novacaledonica]GJH13023.1 hypothetical protein CBA19CS11_29315 [Caballeronia novacaledonica]